MKLKLLSTLLISASVLASGPVFAQGMTTQMAKLAAAPAPATSADAATPAPKKVKKAKKAKAAPVAAAKGSEDFGGMAKGFHADAPAPAPK